MNIQWSLVLFTALTGTAGWMFACIFFAQVKGYEQKSQFKASLVATILGIAGGIASVTHLSHPEHIMNVLGHPTEGVFLEAVLTGIMCLAGIVYLFLQYKKTESKSALTFWSCIAAVFGVALSFAAGHSYMMADIPAWNTLLLPIGYVATAIPCGAATYLLVADKEEDSHIYLGGWGKPILWGSVLAAVCSAAYFIYAGNITLAIILAALNAVTVYLAFKLKKVPATFEKLMYASLICSGASVLLYRIGMWLVFDKAINLLGFVI